jgi:hypothetical protein
MVSLLNGGSRPACKMLPASIHLSTLSTHRNSKASTIPGLLGLPILHGTTGTRLSYGSSAHAVGYGPWLVSGSVLLSVPS